MAKIDPYVQRFPTKVPLLNKNGIMNKEWVDWFDYDNLWKQGVFVKLGGGEDLIEQAITSFGINLNSQLSQLRREFEGLPEFTIDTSGFTTDLTPLTTDKAIA